ncbi:Cysteine-rich receptor-like protein kinase 2 [Capsicum annuum]|uniref:Cysteine-rich receptor-like protein kinase 2 n=3 Tax=Capsicum annuum TaxID=4072 RepID=A0A1U8EWZ9_CAPAN|nr:cysteine-rich receptor-like protein kinase 2 isoform X1 [Capsicum annuum]PHT68322.1 Cysteine-rich receptor-like protein kinase 2 [Capsicum annuum]
MLSRDFINLISCSREMDKAMTLVAFRLFVFLSILLLPNVSEAEPRSQTVQIICGNQVEHNATAFVPNFIATMETISGQMRTRGYGVALTGSGPDANYGLAQCYGDLSLLDCTLCYAEARTVLPQCFPFNGGRIYLDGCFMRSENYTFDHQYLGPEDRHVCGNKTRKGSLFQQTARRAVQQAVANAPNSNGYARAEVAVPGATNETAYVLADCWRTISANSCRACLQNASASMMGCLPWSEGRALYTGCFMRYSDVNFLNAIASSGDSSSKGSVVVIIIAVVSAVAIFVMGATITFYMWKNKQIQKKRKGSNDVEKLVKTLNDSSLNFKYSTLEKATRSFDKVNKLGQGGFGTVYKGVLQDGREIAVKRLFFNNKHRAADFYNEVNIISSVEHKNLVRLLGCSCSGPESLLVYEFLPNHSLDRFIFDPSKGKTLNWEKRFDIIIGTAEGLVYLHENNKTRIIHRDIKASNILLDSRLRAKIADFGLARSFQEDKSHISTAIAGTLGYMAPEYLAHGQLTEKADVYSFGVLLLEIVTGRQNNRSKNTEYSDSLISIAWHHFQHERVEELFDPNLTLHNHHTSNVKREVLRMVHVGLLCTQEVPGLRPSMSKALQMLVKKEEELPAPTNPPFVDEKTMELHDPWDTPSYPHREGDSASIANISHSSFYPR